MARRIRSYESPSVIVDYDAKRCIHSEKCVHGLPAVFDADRRPWIDPGAATPEEVVAVVERCPTGALQYRWRDGREGERPPQANTARVAPDGPVYFHGDLKITLPDGEVLEETRAALCRCGHSKDKPFCDNSHVEAGFAHDAVLREGRLVPGEGEDSSVAISFAENGPILVRGPLRVVGQGDAESEGYSGAFCRCGHSAKKPFCDGAHKNVGFEAE